METIRELLALGLIGVAGLTLTRVMTGLNFSDLLTQGGVGGVASSRVPLLVVTILIAVSYLGRIIAATSACTAAACALPDLTTTQLVALHGGSAFYLIDKARISSGAAPLLSGLISAIKPGG